MLRQGLGDRENAGAFVAAPHTSHGVLHVPQPLLIAQIPVPLSTVPLGRDRRQLPIQRLQATAAGREPVGDLRFQSGDALIEVLDRGVVPSRVRALQVELGWGVADPVPVHDLRVELLVPRPELLGVLPGRGGRGLGDLLPRGDGVNGCEWARRSDA